MTCRCTGEHCALTRIESLVEAQAGPCCQDEDPDDEQFRKSVN